MAETVADVVLVVVPLEDVVLVKVVVALAAEVVLVVALGAAVVDDKKLVVLLVRPEVVLVVALAAPVVVERTLVVVLLTALVVVAVADEVVVVVLGPMNLAVNWNSISPASQPLGPAVLTTRLSKRQKTLSNRLRVLSLESNQRLVVGAPTLAMRYASSSELGLSVPTKRPLVTSSPASLDTKVAAEPSEPKVPIWESSKPR